MERTAVNTKETQSASEFGVVYPIGVELFSTKLTDSPQVLREVGQRAGLINLLRSSFESSSERSNAEIFRKLGEFIRHDSNNARIILYLPFEMLPNIKEGHSEVAHTFAKIVHDGWFRLLFESEVRASFDDGDDLEPGLGAPPRTRKAAHLIPELMSRGIVTEKEIQKIMSVVDDDEIRQAITEGLAFAQNGAAKKEVHPERTVGEISSSLAGRLMEIEKLFRPGSDYLAQMSEKRKVWQKVAETDNAINQASEDLSSLIISGKVNLDALFGEFETTVVLRSLTKAAEDLDIKGKVLPKHLMENLKFRLTAIWQDGTEDEREEVFDSINQLTRLGILPTDFATGIGVKVFDLSQPSPVDIDEFARNEGRFVADAAKIIARNQELSKNIYPFILVLGSRIKGYSNLGADFDFAIFFKPDANPAKRTKILEQLKHAVPEIEKTDKFLEFWTTQKDDGLSLKPVAEGPTPAIVGAKQIHFIFGGAWIGDVTEIDCVRSELIKRYLDLGRFGESKEEIRRTFLRQLELDILQYRLLHKGYRKLYPLQKREDRENEGLIDWKSDFWDPGFRKVATLLFLSRVFLPDLSENQTAG
jgi:hypothetical protein